MSNENELKTRTKYIDPLIKESGFLLNNLKDREYEVSGMPNDNGIGFVDYVLWGKDGLPLAVVEAKRTIRSPKEGKHQAKLYADCLEKEFSRRPVIYYSNGYEHWFWDDTNYPSRSVQGFHSKDELELMMQRELKDLHWHRQKLIMKLLNEAINMRLSEKLLKLLRRKMREEAYLSWLLEVERRELLLL